MKLDQQTPKAPQRNSRAPYLAPEIEVIEMQNEGVIAASGSLGDGIGNGGPIGTPAARRGYNAAGSSDLEDMINDILTVEN